MKVDDLPTMLADAFAHAGSLDRDELLSMLAAHGAPDDLRAFVRRRLPSGVRFRDLDAVRPHLPELAGESHEPRLYQIGEVAERVGLSLRTLRYYEEVGLAQPSARSEGGFRLYSEMDVRRLVEVKRMKALGLSVDESRQLLELMGAADRAEELDGGDLGSTVVKLQLVAERADDRIRRLERDLDGARQLRLDLSELLGRCRSAHESRRHEAAQ